MGASGEKESDLFSSYDIKSLAIPCSYDIISKSDGIRTDEKEMKTMNTTMTASTINTATGDYSDYELNDTLLGDSLFGGAETDNIDVEASYAKYIELVSERMSQIFPELKIEIETDLRCVGYSKPAFVLHNYTDEFDTYYEVEKDILSSYDIATQDVFGESETWVVYA
jgi:hypothetical protein